MAELANNQTQVVQQSATERSLATAGFALILILVLGALRLQLMLPGESEIAENRHWVHKVNAPAAFDVVVVGDSRVHRGFSPDSAETINPNLNTLNFGFSFINFDKELLQMAASKLNPNSKQPTIVLGVTPHTLVETDNAQYWQEQQRPLDYAWQYQYVPETALRFFEAFPQGSLVDRLLSRDVNFYRQQYTDDGWAASELDRHQLNKWPDQMWAEFEAGQVSAEIIQSTLEQVTRWHAAGIAVYAYRPPTSAEMIEVESQVSGFDQAAFVAAFELAGGVWIDLPLYDAEYISYDGSHLIPDSAEKLSREIATAIQLNVSSNQ